MRKMSIESVDQLLDSAYKAAINGIPGTLSAEELAEEYLNKSNSKMKAVDDLVKWQIAKCGTSGFISGLGGIITIPIGLPANIVSVIYIQIRMIAAIAYIGGYNIKDDKVKSLVYLCLCGNSAKDIAKAAGIQFGTKFSKAMIEKIPGHVIIKINQKVGFRFLTKFGEKGVVNIGKMIPLAGGIIGLGFDTASTKIISKMAKSTFIYDDMSTSVKKCDWKMGRTYDKFLLENQIPR